MRILYLYNNECALELASWLREQGHDVIECKTRLSESWCREQAFELAVSYTYRYILTGEVLSALGGNVVNLHNSYLPWNRGADPNIWSILDGTPRGVTLHYVDERLDKGDIIAQRFVGVGVDETFESSYMELDSAAKELFKEAFRYYSYWPEMRKTALGRGNYHALADGLEIKKRLGSYQVKISDYLSGGNQKRDAGGAAV